MLRACRDKHNKLCYYMCNFFAGRFIINQKLNLQAPHILTNSLSLLTLQHSHYYLRVAALINND